MSKHTKKFLPTILAMAALGSFAVEAQEAETLRLNPTHESLSEKSRMAALIIEESVRSRDQSIPLELMSRAVCIATVPNVLRVGFIFGVKMGTGFVSCRIQKRNGRSTWSNPSALKIKGGSWGFQVGADSTDLILVFVNPSAATYFSRGNLTLGAALSISAGPIGRGSSIGSDYLLRSEIYSYSHSRGLFAGLALDGSALSVDKSANKLMYDELNGMSHSERALEILSQENDRPSSYVNALNRYAR